MRTLESHDALIDAHRTAYSKKRKGGVPVRCFPNDPETLGFVRRWKRDMAAWETLYRKLGEG